MTVHGFLIVDSSRYQSGRNMGLAMQEQGAIPHVVCRNRDLSDEFTALGICSTYIPLNSLSSARNAILMACTHEIENDDVVVFCDDDGWWPMNFVRGIDSLMLDKMWALIPYSKDSSAMTNNRFPNEIVGLTPRKVCDLASSLGLVVRGAALKKVGMFNESLGVGSKIPIGEDTEYALRLLKEYPNAVYVPDLWQCHPVGNERNADRIAASIFFLFMQSGKFPILFLSFLRSLRHLFCNSEVRSRALTIIRNLF